MTGIDTPFAEAALGDPLIGAGIVENEADGEPGGDREDDSAGAVRSFGALGGKHDGHDALFGVFELHVEELTAAHGSDSFGEEVGEIVRGAVGVAVETFAGEGGGQHGLLSFVGEQDVVGLDDDAAAGESVFERFGDDALKARRPCSPAPDEGAGGESDGAGSDYGEQSRKHAVRVQSGGGRSGPPRGRSYSVAVPGLETTWERGGNGVPRRRGALLRLAKNASLRLAFPVEVGPSREFLLIVSNCRMRWLRARPR